MKQKMKKCLCLMLSFVFVLSNCQLFAQAATAEDVVKIDAAISEDLLEKATKDMATVKHSLENLQFYANKLLKQSQFASIEPYVLERYEKYLKEVEDLYTSVVNRTVAYNQYLNYPWLDGTGASETIISRAARKYSYSGSRLVVNNKAALEEGSAIRSIREEIGKVIDLGPKGVNYAANTLTVEKKMNSVFNFLGERIEYYDYMLKGTPKAQEVLTERVSQLIAEGVITRERVLNFVLDNMKPEEYRFIDVLKEAKAGNINRLQMAIELRKYLKAIGLKRAKAPVLGLMRHASYDALTSQLTPKTKQLLKDFPELLEEGKTVSTRVAKIGRKAAPVVVIGAVLTAALITEVKSDNHFAVETVNNRKLVELQRNIDNNTAGIADRIMFYTNPQSDKLVNNGDVTYLMDSIVLAANLQEAENNFDIIDNILSEEALAANYDTNEDIQKAVDEQLASITDQVLEDVNMI